MGGHYFIVPAYERPGPVIPPNCHPATLRRTLIAERDRRLSELVYCVVRTSGVHYRFVGRCQPFADIEKNYPIFTAERSVNQRESVVGLVPDDVATIRISYRETAPVLVGVKNNAYLFTPPPVGSEMRAKMDKIKREYRRMRLSLRQQNALARRWNKVAREAEPVKVEWLGRSGKVIHSVVSKGDEKSGTSVGSLRAPIEG